jgi:hypothetical protein
MSETPLGARKDESWYAMCIEPSITKTPVGPVQVSVPYQVISSLSTATGTATHVRFNGDPAFLLDESKMPNCTGDEQGTCGGIRSGTTSGEVIPKSGSGSTTINGKRPVRVGDECTLNNNCKGKFIKATPPSKEPAKPKKVNVKIIPSQKLACPDGRIELTAVGAPKGGIYEWSCDGPGEIVDENGNPKINGDKVYVQMDPDEAEGSVLGVVNVSVEYTLDGEAAEDSKSLRFHPEFTQEVVWQLWEGKISNVISGDDYGVKDKNQIRRNNPLNEFEFQDQLYALVVIPGMHMGYLETRAMQDACNYTFKVRSSALIQNYTHLFPLGDVAQSTASEAFGAIDRNAIAAADAVMNGFGKNKTVYIVAHSQGSEVFAKALELLKGRLTAAELSKIHYQGFGSETFISDAYGLGSVRNVHVHGGDLVPPFGDTAKGVEAGLEFWKAAAALEGNDVFESITHTKKAAGIAKALISEHWEKVESLVHYKDCNALKKAVIILKFDRHDFLKNYWMHVQIPTGGKGKPDHELNQFRDYDEKVAAIITEWNAQVAPKKSVNGFRVVGKSNPLKSAAQKRKQEAVIAVFVDGGDNMMPADSNIGLLYRSLSRPGETKDEKKTLVLARSFSDNGIFEWRHWFGESDMSTHTLLPPTFGGEFRKITEEAYQYIVREYAKLIKAGYAVPKIDLYGSGLGAAIANEVAWYVNTYGIQKRDRPAIAPPGSVKIRFMGLFDMFHALDGIDPKIDNGWHYKKLPSIVEHSAHALAEDETRVVLRPSVIQQSQIHSMVFPGGHNDVGGGRENNQDIMKLSRSWIAEEGSKAGVDYLDQFKLTAAEKAEIMNDPSRLLPGPEGLPAWGDVNPLYWEYRKNVTTGKEASEAVAMIKAALAIDGGPQANRMQGMKNMGTWRHSEKSDYVSEKRKFADIARAVMKTNA